MAHNHGSEYQVKIVCEDGTEELSEWMNSEEQVALAMAAGRRPQVKGYLLRERNVLCPNCLIREQRIVEYPLTDIPSPRYMPHDSRYLVAVGSIDRYAAQGATPPVVAPAPAPPPVPAAAAPLPVTKVSGKPAKPTKQALVKKGPKRAAPKEAAKKASA
jgi:hypothetical protein